MIHQSLDDIGMLEGTDKTSLEQDYLRIYERVFEPIRNDPIELLEIGIANGGSLRSWNRFFPQARIIGVDINDLCRAFAGGRIEVEIGSQADTEFLDKLAKKYRPKIIIDDGSHQADHIFISFEHLFPSLLPGGYYVLEDLHLHFGSNAVTWNPGEGRTPSEYFSNIARRLSADYVEPECEPAIRALHAAIEGVDFFRRAIVIRKKTVGEDPKRRIETMWQLAEQGNHAIVWFGLAAFLMRNNEYVRAEVAAQRGVALKPNDADYLSRLAHAQALQGKLAAAVETAREAVRLSPGSAGLAEQLSRLESQLDSNL